MKNRFISRSFQSGPDSSSGPYGPGDQATQGGPGGQVVRW